MIKESKLECTSKGEFKQGHRFGIRNDEDKFEINIF
jgi:hypothetical protein